MSKGPRPVSSALRSWSRPNTAVATSSSCTRNRVWAGADDETFMRLRSGAESAPHRARASHCPLQKFILTGQPPAGGLAPGRPDWPHGQTAPPDVGGLADILRDHRQELTSVLLSLCVFRQNQELTTAGSIRGPSCAKMPRRCDSGVPCDQPHRRLFATRVEPVGDPGPPPGPLPSAPGWHARASSAAHRSKRPVDH